MRNNYRKSNKEKKQRADTINEAKKSDNFTISNSKMPILLLQNWKHSNQTYLIFRVHQYYFCQV